MEAKEPWNTENWFGSPWNYLPEVIKDFHPPKQVKIHDITLRDGEQQAGVIFSKDDKIRIAEKLAEAGVHRIEAGMPVVSSQDEAAVREIVKRNLGPQIFSFCRCTEDDVRRAADCGVDGVVVEIPVSEQLIQHAYKWPLEKAIDLSIRATRLAAEYGLYTVFFTIDATRTSMDWYLNIIERVARDGHMDALGLVDTFGVLSPHGASYYTRVVKQRIDKPLEIHFHNNFGMAVANTIMSVLAGGEMIHSTVTGIGEGAGNTPMEETVLALLTQYGIDVGIRYDKLTELSNLVGNLAGTLPYKPFVGEKYNDIESGIITNWYRNAFHDHPTLITPILPSFVGHKPPAVVLGKKSGLDSVLDWADRKGISLTPEETNEVLLRVKQRAYEIKGLLSEVDFDQIVQTVMAVKPDRP